MKWIGQYIYDQISRFRSDVYLEDISTGTIASGAHLGLDSNNKIVKAVDGGGDLTSIIAGTGLSGTNLTGPIPTLNVDAAQTQITGLGTVSSGVWNGTKVASAYLDDDTAHLSGSQTFTGTKTLNSFKGTAGATVTNILDEDAMGSDSATALATQQSIKAYADRPARQVVLMKAGFKDALGTTKHYIPLQSELEQTTYNHEMNMFVAPYPGKLLKIMYNGSGNFSGGDVAFTFEQIPRNVAWTTPTVLETVTVTGPTNNSTDPNMATATFGAGSAFVAGDMLMVGLEYDTSVGSSNSRHFFTLVFEFDFSGLA